MGSAITEETSKVLSKLTVLGFTLNSVLDAGEDFAIDDVYDRIGDGTIFSYLSSRFEFVEGWGLSTFSPEEKYRLLGEWQSMANAIDAQRKFGVSKQGLSLLVAYVLQSIQSRLIDGKTPWPGPEPDRNPV